MRVMQQASRHHLEDEGFIKKREHNRTGSAFDGPAGCVGSKNRFSSRASVFSVASSSSHGRHTKTCIFSRISHGALPRIGSPLTVKRKSREAGPSISPLMGTHSASTLRGIEAEVGAVCARMDRTSTVRLGSRCLPARPIISPCHRTSDLLWSAMIPSARSARPSLKIPYQRYAVNADSGEPTHRINERLPTLPRFSGLSPSPRRMARFSGSSTAERFSTTLAIKDDADAMLSSSLSMSDGMASFAADRGFHV